MVIKKEIAICFKLDEIEAMKKICVLMGEVHDELEKIDNDLLYEMNDISAYLTDVLSAIDEHGCVKIEDFRASS